jgi:hypothetical protein
LFLLMKWRNMEETSGKSFVKKLLFFRTCNDVRRGEKCSYLSL